MVNIEDDHDSNCQYRGDGDWSCGDSHRTREKIYWMNEKIKDLQTTLKYIAEHCSDAVCRAKSREALK